MYLNIISKCRVTVSKTRFRVLSIANIIRILALTLMIMLGLSSLELALGSAGDDEPAGDSKPIPKAVNAPAGDSMRIPGKSVAEALASMRIHRGFSLEVAAAEPEIADPVAVDEDENGGLYVVEMRGYPFPEKKPTGGVRRLEDRDGDGRYETSRSFLDGLSWPTSVLAYDGGVFIAAAPDILYAKDRDGDGIADLHTRIYTGFGTQNVQGLLNGLLWGHDGWIYGVSGGNGGEIRDLAHPDRPTVSVRGRDFRFKPDGSAFEAISGGGQFGHAFDDRGRRFTCNNSNHIRMITIEAADAARNPAFTSVGVIADIAVEGGAAPVFRISSAEPWRVVRTRERAADPAFAKRLPPTELVATGFFTSATGVTIYRGSAFPQIYRGNVFIGDVGGNLVHRKILEPAGAIPRARRADPDIEFLASTDNWFRPVNFYNASDGTLYVIDMYRETIEHPESIPEPIKKHLDLTSGRDRGRIYRVVPDGFDRPRPIRLGSENTADLVDLLSDPNGRRREIARRLLTERRDPATIPALHESVHERKNALSRIESLWLLDVFNNLTSDDLILSFDDSDAIVRDQAVRLARKLATSDVRIRRSLLKAADDSDASVRFQAALSIGDLEGADAIEALARIAMKDSDDLWTRAAIQTGLKRRADAFLSILIDRNSKWMNSPAGSRLAGECGSLIGFECDPRVIINTIKKVQANPALSYRIKLEFVDALNRGAARAGGSLRAIVDRDDRELLKPMIQQAVELLKTAESEIDLLIALRAIAAASSETVLAEVPRLLDSTRSNVVQLEAIRILGAERDPKVASILIEREPSLSPAVRREALETLFARKERIVSLLEAIEAKRIAATEIDPERRRSLREHADPAVRSRAMKLFEATSREDRLKIIASYRDSLSLPADSKRGSQVFIKVCSTCHKYQGIGKDVGPDLATVATRSSDDLLIHIFDPNREVSPVYLNYTVATTDGLVISGIIAAESAGSITLKRAEGVRDEIPRSRIAEMRSSGVSLMPEGLEKDLSKSDLADLIAFLREGSKAKIDDSK